MTIRHTFLLLSAVSSLGLALPAFATPAPAAKPAQTSELPLEITAQKALEWNRDKKQYIARQDAKAVQGDFSVTADTLIADYREGAGGATEIYRLTAEGHVSILSGTSTATGDKAIYEVDAGKAVITGNDLKLTSETLTITAKERFEYYSNEGRLVAIGRPLVTAGTDTLEADKVTAWMENSKTADNASPKQGGNLKKAEAEGNVVIVTPGETATSNRAIYDAATNKAQLLGQAKIKRGQDTLEGDRAEMDMTTKVSQMFGSGSKDGRVKGVFFPGKAKAAPAPVKADIKPEMNTAQDAVKQPLPASPAEQ